MLHTIGDPRPLEYWIGRLFPEALINRGGDKVQIVATDGSEMSPQLTENELLIWLDGIEAGTRSGVGYDLIEQAGWVLPDYEIASLKSEAQKSFDQAVARRDQLQDALKEI